MTTSTPNEEPMREALRLAVASVEAGGGPFGAVVVRDGEIVGRGHNRVTLDNDPTAHAEVMAIRDACRNLETFELAGCELYTSCEPCPMCFAAIHWARLARVWFAAAESDAAEAGFDDEAIHYELCSPSERRRLPAERLAVEGFNAPFDAWAAKEDKRPY